MVPDKLRPNYERLIKKLYQARAVDLGWQSKKGEGDDTKQLRPRLLGLVAGKGRDQALIDEAGVLARKWLDDHTAIEPEVAPVALEIAAFNGDAKLFDRVHEEAKKATDRADRGQLLAMLGSFGDPKLVARAMAISITDEFELREGLSLLRGGFENPRTREASYKFVVDNYDKITAKLPELYRPYMALTFVPLCDEKRKTEVEKFWKPRIEKLDGGPLSMKQAMEAMLLCAAAKQAQTPGVVAFLQQQ
jgi:alanyl aminopeptidase